MREILFRGKRKDNGDWVQGNLFVDDTGEECEILVGYTNYRIAWEVIPESVSEFTGLTDKNGKKIFEGDILRYFDNEIQVVKWDKDFASLMLYTYAEYERKKGRKVVKEKTEGWNWICDYPLNEMSIIGNIHDNPELLNREVRIC